MQIALAWKMKRTSYYTYTEFNFRSTSTSMCMHVKTMALLMLYVRGRILMRAKIHNFSSPTATFFVRKCT